MGHTLAGEVIKRYYGIVALRNAGNANTIVFNDFLKALPIWFCFVRCF